MAKVEKSDLSNMNTSINFISQLITDNQDIITSLKEFNTNSVNTLKGTSYDALRNRLSYYIDAFEKQNKIYENIHNNFIVVNNSMINYMEEFNSLDDAYIEQTRTAIENAEKQLAYLEGIVNNSRLTEANRQQIRNAINKLKEEIPRLKKLLEKLTGLKPKDNELDSKLETTKQDIETFNNTVKNITITKYI